MTPGAAPRSNDQGEALATAAAHWTGRELELFSADSWWQQPLVVEHVNERICGERIAGLAGGDERLLRSRLGGRTLGRGVSVGAGNGMKEMVLLRAGLVEHFDLYEIAESRIAFGREVAEQYGIADRITWHHEIDLAAAHPPADLVYWNNALHHMLDVAQAVRWSRSTLADGGIFFVNDFVGPNRMQWSDEMVAAANRVRARLPKRLFVKEPAAGAGPLRRLRRRRPRRVSRPDPAEMRRRDPTESADSESILPAIADTFPSAEVIATGGVVYHLALEGLYGNLEPGDAELLGELLRQDAELADAGLTHYAVVIAQL